MLGSPSTVKYIIGATMTTACYRKTIYRSAVCSVLLYECELSPLLEDGGQGLSVFEITSLRIITRV